jgi:cysteinyl-tRNA synthetase
MSSEYLGEQFDLHHGGIDHITVHHPAEIAQSESAFEKKPWVKYWLHNEFLQVNGGKMSKSLGNAYTIADIEGAGFSPLDLRYFYFMAVFSNPQNFTRDTLKQAKNTREHLQKKIEKLMGGETFADEQIPQTLAELLEQYPTAQQLIDRIDEAMKDNFSTPKLLSVVSNALNAPSEEELKVLYWLEQRILKVGLFDDVLL